MDRDRRRRSRSSRSRSRSRSSGYERRSRDRDSRDSRSRDDRGRRSDRKRRSSSRNRSPRNRSPARPAEVLDLPHCPSPERSEDSSIRNAWDLVLSDKDNFDSWMALVNIAFASDDVPLTRGIFGRFLQRFPYCFGYWIKYAEYERKNNNLVEAIEVYEQAVKVIPVCVDLWIAYIHFMRLIAPDTDEGRNQMATLHNRAVESAGITFLSDKLWEDILMYYHQTQQWKRLAQTYELLLHVPTAQFRKHYENFILFVNSHEPDIILEEREYNEIFEELRSATNIGVDELVTYEPVPTVRSNAEDGDGSETTIKEQDEEDEKPVFVKKHHPVAIEYFRRKIVTDRSARHERTAVLVNARLPFEEKLGRQYFHVKLLECNQLKAWNDYLDFEISQGVNSRTDCLFNRCMVVCAKYENMWLKYALWARSANGSSSGLEIFARAAVHCPKSVILTLAESALYEEIGEISKALLHLKVFDQSNPGYAAIEMRRMGILRRKAYKLDRKCPDYGDIIRQMENLIKSDSSSSDLLSIHTLKLAKFHLRVCRDRHTAKKILQHAIEQDKSCAQLYLQLIDIVYNDPDFSQSRFLDVLDEALESDINLEEKLRISQRKLEFLEDIGTDIEELNNHALKHQMLLEEVGHLVVIRKIANAEMTQMLSSSDKWDVNAYSTPNSGMMPMMQMNPQAMYNMPPPVYVQPPYATIR